MLKTPFNTNWKPKPAYYVDNQTVMNRWMSPGNILSLAKQSR